METLTRTQQLEDQQQQTETEQRPADIEIGDNYLVERSSETGHRVDLMRVSAISGPVKTFGKRNVPETRYDITVIGNQEMMKDADGRPIVAMPSKVLPENYFTPEHQAELAADYERSHPERDTVRDLASVAVYDAMYQIPAMHR